MAAAARKSLPKRPLPQRPSLRTMPESLVVDTYRLRRQTSRLAEMHPSREQRGGGFDTASSVSARPRPIPTTYVESFAVSLLQ
jgi:hypothetical protein